MGFLDKMKEKAKEMKEKIGEAVMIAYGKVVSGSYEECSVGASAGNDEKPGEILFRSKENNFYVPVTDIGEIADYTFSLVSRARPENLRLFVTVKYNDGATSKIDILHPLQRDNNGNIRVNLYLPKFFRVLAENKALKGKSEEIIDALQGIASPSSRDAYLKLHNL